MANTKIKKTYKDAETGITYEFELTDFYVNYGGGITITPIKNAGTETEKRLPATRSNDANINEGFQVPDLPAYDEIVAKRIEAAGFIEELFSKVMEAYKA